MEKVAVELEANVDDAIKNVDRLNVSIKNVGSSSKKSSKELSSGAQIGNEGVKALDRGTKGLASAFVKVGKASKLSGKAMKTALISSGIGLAVVAISLIVEYWDEIAGSIDGVSSEQEDLLGLTQQTLDTQRDQLDVINLMENTLKLQGKTEKQIRDLKKANTISIIKDTKILLLQQEGIKKTQIEASERNQKITAGIISFLSAPVTILLGAIDSLTYGLSLVSGVDATSLAKDFSMGAAALIFDPKDAEKKGNETIDATKKALLKLENIVDGYILQDKQNSKTAGEDKSNTEKEEEKAKAAAIESIRKQLIDTEAEERAEKLRLIQEDYKKQIELAKKYYGEKSTEVLALEAGQKAATDAQKLKWKEEDDAKALAEKEKEAEKTLKEQEEKILKLELSKEFDTLNFEDKKNILNERELQLLNDKTLSEDQRTKLEKSFAKARIDIADLETKGKQTALNGYASALSDVSGVIGQETAAGKAVAVASSLVNTYAAISGQLSAFSTVPVPGYAIAQAIATGVVGLANVKKIISVKVPNSKGGGGGGNQGGSVPTAPSLPPIPPAFNIVGSSGTNQLADAIGGQSQTPVQAYVVSNDVTTAQELDRNIINGASIG